MADSKISQLTAQASGQLQTTDLGVIARASAATNYKVTLADLQAYITQLFAKSVNGVAAVSNTITLDTDDIAEGSTNLYLTNERVDDRVAALLQSGTGIGLTYNDVANTLTIQVSGLTTSDVAEGNNLYFTDERVDDRVAALLQQGNSIVLTYNDAGNTLTVALNSTAIASVVQASGSGGLLLEANNGTDVLLLGAGGGNGMTAYGNMVYEQASANTVAVFNGSKILGSVAVTPTEIGYVAGASAGIQTQINSKVDTSAIDEIIDDRVSNLLVAGSNITLTYNDVANTLTIAAAGGSLTNWTEAYASGTQSTSSFTATNAATNVNAAIVPKGNGAITGNIPDGTTTGGNSRGAFAVDLQLSRSAATQVASSNFSAIGGGANNTANAIYATIAGGQTNAAAAVNSSLGGGQFNSITSNNAYGVIAGGQSNSAGGFGYASVGGGNSNSAGVSYATIAGGNGNTVSGQYGSIGGGNINTISKTYGVIAGGFYGVANNYGSFAHAGGRRANAGDAQKQFGVLRNTLTSVSSGSSTRLWLDGTTGTENFDASGNDRSWNVTVKLIARCSATSGSITAGDTFSETVSACFKRVGGTGSIVGTPTQLSVHNDASMAGGGISLSVVSNQLAVSFTHPTAASNNSFYVVAEISVIETA